MYLCARSRDVTVAARPPGEPVQVRALAAERLGDPQPGHVLGEVRVDDGDPLARLGVGPGRLQAEHHRRHGEHRHDRQHQQPEPDVDHQHRREHPEEREQRRHHRDEPGLQERRQRVHVGGHAGHDPPGHLPLVEVEAEPLQLREDLHPQRVQQPLAVAADDHRRGDVDQPVGDHDTQADQRQQHAPRGASCAWTPWLIPPRTSAGSARLAPASSPLSTSPATSATRDRPEQLAQRERGVARPRLREVAPSACP